MPYPTASSGNERTFSSLHNLISTTDISSKITYANEHFCDIAGYRQEELEGEYPGRDRERFITNIKS